MECIPWSIQHAMSGAVARSLSCEKLEGAAGCIQRADFMRLLCFRLHGVPLGHGQTTIFSIVVYV